MCKRVKIVIVKMQVFACMLLNVLYKAKSISNAVAKAKKILILKESVGNKQG